MRSKLDHIQLSCKNYSCNFAAPKVPKRRHGMQRLHLQSLSCTRSCDPHTSYFLDLLTACRLRWLSWQHAVDLWTRPRQVYGEVHGWVCVALWLFLSNCSTCWSVQLAEEMFSQVIFTGYGLFEQKCFLQPLNVKFCAGQLVHESYCKLTIDDFILGGPELKAANSTTRVRQTMTNTSVK